MGYAFLCFAVLRWLTWLSQMSRGGFTASLCGEIKREKWLWLTAHGWEGTLPTWRRRGFLAFMVSPSSFIIFSLSLSWLRTNSRRRLQQHAKPAFQIKHHKPSATSPWSSLVACHSVTHLSRSFSTPVSLPSQTNSAMSVYPPSDPLKHTPSILPSPQSEINQC